MSASESLSFGLDSLFEFLKEELAYYPGRLNLVLRVVLASAVVMVTSLTLQVPFLMLSMLAVLSVTLSNVVVSSLAAFMSILGVSLSVVATVILLRYTYDFPLLRILGANAFLFACVFMMRTTAYASAFFIAGLNVIYIQTFADQTDNAEHIVRQTLWAWVAITYPAVLSMLFNGLLMPLEPQRQLKAEIHRQLKVIDERLAILLGKSGTHSAITLPQIQKGTLSLQKLLSFAVKKDKKYRAEEARHLAIIATVSRLFYATSELPQDHCELADDLAEELQELRSAIETLDKAIATDHAFELQQAFTTTQDDSKLSSIAEMQTALQVLSEYEANPTPTSESDDKSSIFADDAFTNPSYAQFALKTVLAVLISYVFYVGVDWLGIHTVMLTCLIVAQSSLGASVLKGWLRIIGAIIGSIIALFMMVFVIPYITDIVGVLMMTLPVVALSSWIMGGSERVSYIGFQIVVTFALALLEDFSPVTDVSEISDRIIGVFLGVAISMAIHVWIWPEGEGKDARRSLAALLKAIGKLLQPIHKVTQASSTAVGEQQVAVLTKLADCESLLARLALEPNGRESQQEGLTLELQTLVGQSRSLMLAANALRRELNNHQRALPEDIRQQIFSAQQQAAAKLEIYADGLVGEACEPPQTISLDAIKKSFANASTEVSERRTAAIMEAMENVAKQLSNLPRWGEPLHPSMSVEESPRHA